MTSTEFDALKAMRSKFTRQYRNLSATKREALRKETLGLLSSKVSKHYRLGMLAWFQKGIKKKSFVKNESRESRFIKKFTHDGQFADVQKLRAIRKKFQNKYKFLHGEERIRFQKKTEEWIKKQAKSLGPKVDPKGMLKWFTKKLSNKKKVVTQKKVVAQPAKQAGGFDVVRKWKSEAKDLPEKENHYTNWDKKNWS